MMESGSDALFARPFLVVFTLPWISWHSGQMVVALELTTWTEAIAADVRVGRAVYSRRLGEFEGYVAPGAIDAHHTNGQDMNVEMTYRVDHLREPCVVMHTHRS